MLFVDCLNIAWKDTVRTIEQNTIFTKYNKNTINTAGCVNVSMLMVIVQSVSGMERFSVTEP